MNENYLTLFFTIGLVAYAIGIRVLVHILVDAEKKKTQLLTIIGLWGFFMLGEIVFFRYMLSFLIGLENIPSEIFMTLIVIMLIWNVLWLFIIVIGILLKKKRKLTKIQEAILQDL